MIKNLKKPAISLCTSLDFFLAISNRKKEINFILFHLCIYSPDLQNSDGDAVLLASNNFDLLTKIPRYCRPVKMFYLNFLVL